MIPAGLMAALVIAVGSRGTEGILRELARLTGEVRRLVETQRQAALDEDDRRRAQGPKKRVGFDF